MQHRSLFSRFSPTRRRSVEAGQSGASSAWPDQELTEHLPAVAGVISQLLADEPGWIHRRVETFEFVDDRTVRRRMSVDLTPPRIAPAGCPYLLPLTLLKKIALRNLDVRSSDGGALSVLTSGQNAPIAAAVLVQQAADVVELADLGDLTSPVVDDLLAIAGVTDGDRRTRREAARAALGRIDAAYKSAAPAGSQVDRQRSALVEEPSVYGLIQEFEQHFVFLVHCPVEPGERTIIKFGYDAPFVASGIRRFFAGLGGTEVTVNAQVAGPFDAASYHAEVIAPDDMIISEASLRAVEYVLRPDPTNWRQRVIRRLEQVGIGRESPVVLQETELDSDGGRSRVHLSTAGLDETKAHLARIRVEFTLWRGAVLTAVVSAGATAVILWSGLVIHWAFDVRPRNEIAAPLIVVLPAIYATLAASKQHRLTQRLYGGLQAAIVLSACLSFAGASLLALVLKPETVEWIWTSLSIGAAILLGISIRAFLHASKKARALPERFL